MFSCLKSFCLFRSSQGQRKGFTLIEMLVAIAVLTLLMVAMSQISTAITRMVGDGKRRTDNFTKARSTMEVFMRDVKAGIFRGDIAAFKDAAGQNAICFYTGRPGIGSGMRNVSLVLYSLDPTTGVLQRGALPIAWSGQQGTPEMISFGYLTQLPKFSEIVPEDMAEGVLRMEINFLDEVGGLSKSYKATSPNRTRAVGITLAVIDQDTMKLLTNAQIARLTDPGTAGSLPDDSAQSPGQPLKKYWEGLIGSADFFDGYPAQLRSSLRIYERYVVLPVQ